MKKAFSLLMLAMILVFTVLPFGSAFASNGFVASNNLTDGNPSTTTSYNSEATLALSSDSVLDNVTLKVYEHSSSTYVITLKLKNSSGTIVETLTQTVPKGTDVASLLFDVTNGSLIHSISVSSSSYPYDGIDISYNVVAPVVHDELSNLSYLQTYNNVGLSWTIPTGNVNFTGTKIYGIGTFLTSVDSMTTSYQDNTVSANTTYDYKVTAVYSDAVETTGISTGSFLTDTAPPDPSTIPPSNVTSLTVGVG